MSDFELFYIFLMAKELRAIKYLHCTVLTQKGLKMILGLFVLTPNIQGILLLLHPWPLTSHEKQIIIINIFLNSIKNIKQVGFSFSLHIRTWLHTTLAICIKKWILTCLHTSHPFYEGSQQKLGKLLN